MAREETLLWFANNKGRMWLRTMASPSRTSALLKRSRLNAPVAIRAPSFWCPRKRTRPSSSTVRAAAFPVSCSLRAALASFTKLYADRYAAAGIRMNNILPGFVDSYPETEENLDRIPMGRYASTAEIARTALFLASPESAYITGQNIRVDGGLTRSV